MREFSTAELERMMGTVNSALPSSGTIKRPSRTSDGMGGATESPVTVTTADCRVDPPGKGAALQVYAERLGERQMNVICFPAGTDVQEGDEVTVGSVVYEVMGIVVEGWEVGRLAVTARHG